MGFKNGAFATVWKTESIWMNLICRMPSFLPPSTAEIIVLQSYIIRYVMVRSLQNGRSSRAARLKEKDRIKLGEVDVTTRYSKEKNTTYTNYKVFSFEDADSKPSGSVEDDFGNDVDSGEISENNLPF